MKFQEIIIYKTLVHFYVLLKKRIYLDLNFKNITKSIHLQTAYTT